MDASNLASFYDSHIDEIFCVKQIGLESAMTLKKYLNFTKMSSDSNFTVASWFLGNVLVKSYFNTQCLPPSECNEIYGCLLREDMGEWNMIKLLIKIVKRPSKNIPTLSSFYILMTVAFIEGKNRKSSSPKIFYSFFHNDSLQTSVCMH